MSIGLPIACSNQSSLPEILHDGGVYFDPRSPASIAKAIEDLIVDPLMREQSRLRREN